jgi:hypothetical protein
MLTGDINQRIDSGLRLRESPQGWPFLLWGLDCEKPEVRRACLNAMVFTPWPSVAPRLEELAIHDPDPDVRETAVLALGPGGRSASSFPVLHQAMSDPDPAVRRAVGTALADMASLGMVEVIPSLVLAAKRESPAYARGEALSGLYELLTIALDKDSDIAVEEVATPDVVATFQAALGDAGSPMARLKAVRAATDLGLSELHGEVLGLTDEDTEPDWRVRHFAAKALGKFFKNQFNTRREDRDLRRTVSRLLRANVEDTDQSVRFAAMAALRDIGYDPGKWRPYEEEAPL